MTLETDLRTHRERLEQDEAPGLQEGAPRWSPYWDRCRACGTQEMPHRGRGLCDLCYVRLRMLRLLPPLTGYVTAGSRNRGAWSRAYKACRVCGTTERPHHARGMCARCYMQWLRARAEGQEALPAAPGTLEEENGCLSGEVMDSERSTALKGP
jgi:ribosomal protein L32